jgi:hypothetical protein
VNGRRFVETISVPEAPRWRARLYIKAVDPDGSLSQWIVIEQRQRWRWRFVACEASTVIDYRKARRTAKARLRSFHERDPSRVAYLQPVKGTA